RASIWPAIHPQILELIRSHRSTLIFVNSRRLAERLAGALNDLAGEELVHAHHGSVAREQRLRIADARKAARLPPHLATSRPEPVMRRAAPFAELPRSAFEGVLDMLSGRYPSDEFAELRPRIVWDRTAGIVRSREGAKVVAISNGGTIPDRGLYGVFLAGAEK